MNSNIKLKLWNTVVISYKIMIKYNLSRLWKETFSFKITNAKVFKETKNKV
jgi:hypothetical protein